jgi:hypothetical protein
MDPRINDRCPPTSDPMHSMAQVSEAYQLLSQALEMVRKAEKLMTDEWQWHRPDCNWKLPADYAAHAEAARENIRPFLADAYWTQNSLRKYGKPDENEGANIAGEPRRHESGQSL